MRTIKNRRVCSLPCYRDKHQYTRLKQFSIDKENFTHTYEEAKKLTELKKQEMKRKGFKVVLVDVDVDELIAWCDFKGLPLDPRSRTQFAMDKLKEMISNKQVKV